MEQLIIETMQSYNDYLGNLVSGCDGIASKLKSNNISEGLQLILQFSEGTTWLINVNQTLENLGYSNELNHESIHDFLHEINSSLEIQDYVLVSDIFKYEIKSFFENCQSYSLQA